MKKLSIIASIILTAGILFPDNRFTDNSNDTINDGNTGLIWQKCSNGLSGTGCSIGTAASLTWVNAISYCEGLTLGGRSNWRLPNINELKTIVLESTVFRRILVMRSDGIPPPWRDRCFFA